MQTKWNVFGQAQNLDELKQLLLAKRGLTAEEDAQNFLRTENPLKALRLFPNDFKRALKSAKELIEYSAQKEMPILIMGDYDADGVCATSILYNYLFEELGYAPVYYFIPNRFDHGYGLSKESIDSAIVSAPVLESAEKILFITVDCGITSRNEAEYIKSLGHDLIITDHHQKLEELPAADVIIWSDEVVAASVAWILTRILGAKEGDSVALAALATVADVQPLLGMNRAIVRLGLEVINLSPPAGLEELIQVSGVSGKDLGTYELGWVLGPRINAAGRLADASRAVELFTCDNAQQRLKIAHELDQINTSRQDETARMYDLSAVSEDIPRFILSTSEEYHEGIIGLVASRLVRKYYRPSIVISTSGEYGKGSVRSIAGINIIEILREFDDLFVNLGGHPMAAGFTIPKDNISILEAGLHKVFADRFDEEIFVRSMEIDAEIPLDLVNWDLYEFLKSLKPFGEGNRPPLFVSRGLRIADISFVGRDKTHTSLKFYDGKKYQKAIYFNSRELLTGIVLGDAVDVVYSVRENVFNGNSSLDLFVEEVRKS